MRRIVSAIALVSLAALAAGCWSSDTPLLPTSALTAPPMAAGEYAKADSTTRYRLTRQGNVMKVEIGEEGGSWTDDSTLKFVSLGGSYYLAMQTADSVDDYLLFRTNNGGRVTVFVPSCTDSVSGNAFVEYDEDDEYCYFSDYATLKRLAGELKSAIERGDTSGVYEAQEYVPAGSSAVHSVH